MRLGTDALKFPGASSMTPVELVNAVAAEGFDGIFFRTMLTMSPSLDPGELAEIRTCVDDHGMYLESGLGEVNPFGLPENPEFRALGDGDTLLGFRRIIEAASSVGITELWAATANIKPFIGKFAYDRFRTDVSWADQLVAIEKLMRKLAPIARDHGIHINLETHEEITSFELVRLVESIGPDAIGITFDTANVVQRAEHPIWAARRVAPYVRQTHLKDTALFRSDSGVLYQMRPNGHGVVDLDELLRILHTANPNLNLSLELAQIPSSPEWARLRLEVALYDPDWLELHPDLSVDEFAAFNELVDRYERHVDAVALADYDTYSAEPFGYDEALQFARLSAANVRGAAERLGISLDAPSSGARV